MRAWSLLSFGEDRDFQGNTGYADVLESLYVYDSSVQNSKQVAVGDLVVVRGKEAALGVAWVQGIDVDPAAVKTRMRCPRCGVTGFKRRFHLSPQFLCTSCRHEFDVPVEEEIGVTRYVAHYSGTWRTLEGAISVESLNEVALNRSKQQSIRPLDRAKVERLLAGLRVPLAPTGDLPKQKVDGGRRQAVVEVRFGQDTFRRALLRRYGLVCAVTGPCPGEALQAAHLRPFAEHQSHDVEEGLPLRADVHQLFDRGLLSVDPEALRVHIAPTLHDYPHYLALAGAPLAVEVPPPARLALADHFEVSTARWG